MLMPRKVKHRKHHRGGPIRGIAARGNEINFGSFALKALGTGLVTARQIEAARRAITRYLQRGGKLWIRVFPDKPMTKKGDEVPMGKGKGSVDHFVARVQPGKILFEVDGVTQNVAEEAFRLAGHKFGLRTKFIVKQ
ncbi:MAG TPA: 50S ribosomal protein L16 [Patescibacteria group bacterium]|nr:50S ribosomal protein L16 [Patescibacteria group bacterium]